MKPELGLAIVGCGQIVTHHVAAIMTGTNPDTHPFVIRALVDPSSHRRQVIRDLLVSYTQDQKTGTSVAEFDSLLELLQDPTVLATVHVIFIAVPHDLHEPLAMEALSNNNNKIVVMEKPLEKTLEACNRLVQVSSSLQQQQSSASTSSSGSMLIVAEQSPYWQEVVLAKKLVQQPQEATTTSIGTIVSAAAYYYESMRDNITSGDTSLKGGLGWRGSLERAGGGICIDGGLHWIRPLREILGGRISRVVGVTRRNLAPQLQCEGEVLAHALFEIETTEEPPESALSQPKGSGPLVATYSCNLLATAPMAHDVCPYFRITGTQGELVIHGDGLFAEKPGAGGLRLYNEEYPLGKELFDSKRMGGFFLGFAALWQEIYRICVEGDQEAAHETVVRAADDVKTVLALYRSSASGQWEST